MSVKYRDDMFAGEEGHPQCCFFEAFDSDPNPYNEYYSLFYCHMGMGEDHAEVCKGDYLECPIAYGRLSSLTPVARETAAPECEHGFIPFLCRQCAGERYSRRSPEHC